MRERPGTLQGGRGLARLGVGATLAAALVLAAAACGRKETSKDRARAGRPTLAELTAEFPSPTALPPSPTPTASPRATLELYRPASPTPMETTIFWSLGTAIGLAYPKRSLKAGTISLLY